MAINKKKKRKVFTGWIPKRTSVNLSKMESEDEELFGELYATRGRKEWYDSEDWPPVKVKVIVEMEA